MRRPKLPLGETRVKPLSITKAAHPHITEFQRGYSSAGGKCSGGSGSSGGSTCHQCRGMRGSGLRMRTDPCDVTRYW